MSANIRLEQTSKSPLQSCFDIELYQLTEGHAMLAGQNYRLFYNSAASELDPESIKTILKEDQYEFRLVQDRKHVDASRVNNLSFDSDLGFINASIILNATNARGKLLIKDNWVSVASMCFELTDQSQTPEIVLARSALTAEYGRAYIEISYVDEKGEINTLDLIQYQDFSAAN